MHVQLAEATPAPVPSPAVVHWHPVEASLGPGDGGDGVAEADAAFYFWHPEETPEDTAVADAAVTAVADAAWIQQGIEEVLSYHIAEFDWTRVPEGVPADQPPPEGDPPPADAPPPLAAPPTEPPLQLDVFAVA